MTYKKKSLKKKGKQRPSHPAHTLISSLPLFCFSNHIFSSDLLSLMTKMKSEWSWAFFGWLSPRRVLSAGSAGTSPSPWARISSSALGRSRSASHSVGCPWCALWCTSPGSPEAIGETETNKSLVSRQRYHLEQWSSNLFGLQCPLFLLNSSTPFKWVRSVPIHPN